MLLYHSLTIHCTYMYVCISYQLEDEQLEEERERRKQEEKEMEQKLEALKARHSEVMERVDRRMRIAGMRKEEDRLQKLMLEKVKEDREREQRIKDMLKQSLELEDDLRRGQSTVLPLHNMFDVKKEPRLPGSADEEKIFGDEKDQREEMLMEEERDFLLHAQIQMQEIEKQKEEQ